MSQKDTFWFHCGGCGRLYASEIDFSDDRLCPHCGGHPAPSPTSAPPAQDAVVQQQPVALSGAAAPVNRTSRRVRGVYKFILAWVILIAAIYGIARWVQSRDDTLVSGNPQAADVSEPAVIDEDREFLDEVLPSCREVLDTYLRAAETVQRQPLVIPAPGIKERMERHYADNKPLKIDPQTLNLTASTVVDLPEGRTVLTQWEGTEGGSFDAAFRQIDDRWALDWDHFERHSDLSWSQFLAGDGDEDIATFRLHARRRMASKEDPHNGIGVVLSSSMRRNMEEVGYSESMEGMSLNEADGKRLQAAFERAAAGIPLLGAKVRDINPEGMIRVRVKVQRIGEDGGFKYRVAEVLACHWYASEATGLE